MTELLAELILSELMTELVLQYFCIFCRLILKLITCNQMSHSTDCGSEEDILKTNVHSVVFTTVKIHYDIRCPGCDKINKPENFNQKSSTEPQVFRCKNCLGFFLLTTNTIMTECLVMKVTFVSSEKKRKAILPSELIASWKLSETNDVIHALLGIGTKFDISLTHVEESGSYFISQIEEIN